MFGYKPFPTKEEQWLFDLSRRGIRVIPRDRGPFFECKSCRHIWGPILKVNGRFPNNYWRCPHRGCNNHFKTLANVRERK